MMKRVAIVEWTDKNGLVWRSPPFDENDIEAMKSGIRDAFYAMCKPFIKYGELTEEGYFYEP